ncbi:MAG: hypothetical protein ACE5OZ_22975 [Candidatus Heimdallarchaeota archaeon]
MGISRLLMTNSALRPEEFLILVSWVSDEEFILYTLWLIAVSIAYLSFWYHLINFWRKDREQAAKDPLEGEPKSFGGRTVKVLVFCCGLPFLIIGGVALYILTIIVGSAWIFFIELFMGTAEQDTGYASVLIFLMVGNSIVGGFLGGFAFICLIISLWLFKYAIKDSR